MPYLRPKWPNSKGVIAEGFFPTGVLSGCLVDGKMEQNFTEAQICCCESEFRLKTKRQIETDSASDLQSLRLLKYGSAHAIHGQCLACVHPIRDARG